MKKYFKNKYLIPFLFLVLLVGGVFVVKAQTQHRDDFDFGYFQCSRHGHNESQNCHGVWDYYGSRNDYVGGSASFIWEGHRHGASGINSQVCLHSSFDFQCQAFACAGDTCGHEYGGTHPWNQYANVDFSFSSPPSLYKIFRSASVNDAEIRVYASGYAVYVEPVYGCTDPTANNYDSSATVDNGTCTYTINMVNLNFIVRNQNSTPISGASVNIDQNFGNGTQRTTDGSGFANFGVNANTNIGYSVLADGCTAVNSSVNSGNNGVTVEVTMNCTGVTSGNPPTCFPSDQHAFINQTVNFTADSNGGGPVNWSAPGGIPANGAGLSFSTTYTTDGVKTVTASNDNGSTYYSSCTVNVQDEGTPPPNVFSVDRPACSNTPYNVIINWPGFPPGMLNGVPTYFVDVTTDATWNTFWNKRITDGSVSTIALDNSFSCLLANSCPGAPVGEDMILQPNKTYYTRLWNGSHQPDSNGISFNVPSCDPPPTLNEPTLPNACRPPGEPYTLTLNWFGAPHPTEGYYVDVTTDSSFNSFWNKKIDGSINSTTALVGFSCLSDNWCFNPPPGNIVLEPGTTYYARVYGGGGHSNIREFTMPMCRLLSASYSGDGTVTGPVGVTAGSELANGINCGPGLNNCSEWYVDEAGINVVANPSTNNRFVDWASGAGMVCPGSTVSSCVFTINSDRSARANFAALASFDYSLDFDGIVNLTNNVGGSISHPGRRILAPGLTTGQPVNLQLIGVPPGVSSNITNNHTSCPLLGCAKASFENRSDLQFSIVDDSAPLGSHTITVRGTTAGGPTREDTFTLEILPPAITVSCSSNPAPPATAALGQQVTWTAVANGANPPFSYRWFGVGFPTPAPTVNPYTITYSTIGNKTASVEVVDNIGRVVTAVCNNGIPLRVRFSPIFQEF